MQPFEGDFYTSCLEAVHTHVAMGFTSGEVLEPSHQQAELEHEDGERLTSLKSACVYCSYLNQQGDQSNL